MRHDSKRPDPAGGPEMPTLTEARLHLEHGDGAVSRTFAVTGWPAAAWWGFWQPLLRLRDYHGRLLRVRLALVAAPYAATFWSDEQKYHVRRLRTEAEAHRRNGASWRANELDASAAALEALKNREVMEGAATFDALAVVTVTAADQATLDADCAAVVEWAQACGLTLTATPYTQLPAFMAGSADAAPALPAGLPHRILDEDALAALVPAQDGPWGGRGVYAGVRASDGAFVTLPLDDPNAPEGTNLAILGTNGSGKSFYAKALLTGLLLSGFRVVVFDVDGEFRDWCEAWGGVWVDHTPGSGRYVEPMRLARRPGGYEDMVRRIEAVVSVLAGGLDAVAENVVDKVTALTCRAAGVDPKSSGTWGRPLRIRDWYATLAAVAGWERPGARGDRGVQAAEVRPTRGDEGTEASGSAGPESQGRDAHPSSGRRRRRGARGSRPGAASDATAGPALPPALRAAAVDLAARLEPYFLGGLSYVFGAEDPVDFAAPLVVIHAADATDSDDRLAGLKMLLAGAAVREMIEEEGRAGRRFTAVHFDEGQRLLQNPHMRRYASDLFTAIRKRNGMAMLASNSTRALFAAEGGVTAAGDIWQNARGKVFLAMSREALEDIRRHGKVPADVVDIIEGLRPADHLAVLEWDGRYDVVRMDVSVEEAALYRTRGLGARRAPESES